MGAGDTQPGAIRVVRVTGIGKRLPVAGAFPSALLDHLTDTENGIYINPRKGATLPLGMLPKAAPNAQFSAGEVMEVQIKTSAAGEAAVTTNSEIQIDVVQEDLNTKDIISKTLMVTDTDLTGDVTTSTTAWTTFFAYTVPDRTRITLMGSFNATCLEKA